MFWKLQRVDVRVCLAADSFDWKTDLVFRDCTGLTCTCVRRVSACVYL
jgi:hypothetical protein